MSWKYFYASVAGTSHKERNIPLQDSINVQVLNKSDSEKIIIIAVADGAGSASHSHIGSNLACKLITNKVKKWLEQDNQIEQLTAEIIEVWLANIRTIFYKVANGLSLDSIRQLAATLLVSIVASEYSFFFQIGDGAIVIKSDNEYKCIFWPQTGEYANTTYFITDNDISKNLMVALEKEQVKEFAMFTDGIQSIALEYINKKPYEPFFRPFFNVGNDLSVGLNNNFSNNLSSFLNSERVNARTDDDKTLLIATCT